MESDYYTHTVEDAAAYERERARDAAEYGDDPYLDAAESDAMLACPVFGGPRIPAAYVPDDDDLPF